MGRNKKINMKRSILITGVAGSGKTTISNKLKEMGYTAYDIDRVKGLCRMVHKETGATLEKQDNDNLEEVVKGDWICDADELKKLIANTPDKIAFYCGVNSNMEELIPLFDKLIMLKANEEATRERLTNRTSNDFGRTAEVQDWIMTWKDWWEKEMIEKGAVVIDSNRPLDGIVKEIIERSMENSEPSREVKPPIDKNFLK